MKRRRGGEARDDEEKWSRRGELNTPSAEDYSAALTVSYTGKVKENQVVAAATRGGGRRESRRNANERALSATLSSGSGTSPANPRWTPAAMASRPFMVNGT